MQVERMDHTTIAAADNAAGPLSAPPAPLVPRMPPPGFPARTSGAWEGECATGGARGCPDESMKEPPTWSMMGSLGMLAETIRLHAKKTSVV